MFTTATNLFEFYGPLVGVPAMALATYTGFARMAAHRHHLSDVIFGATIGILFSHAFNRHHKSELSSLSEKSEPQSSGLTVIPAVTALNEFSLSLRWNLL